MRFSQITLPFITFAILFLSLWLMPALQPAILIFCIAYAFKLWKQSPIKLHYIPNIKNQKLIEAAGLTQMVRNFNSSFLNLQFISLVAIWWLLQNPSMCSSSIVPTPGGSTMSENSFKLKILASFLLTGLFPKGFKNLPRMKVWKFCVWSLGSLATQATCILWTLLLLQTLETWSCASWIIEAPQEPL